MSLFNKNIQGQFEKATKDKSESEKREIEMQLLKPEPIPPYGGEKPLYTNELDARTVVIVFRDYNQMELIGEMFSIRRSGKDGQAYITDIGLLEHIARRVKNGSLLIKKGKIVLPPKLDIRHSEHEECTGTETDSGHIPEKNDPDQSQNRSNKNRREIA